METRVAFRVAEALRRYSDDQAEVELSIQTEPAQVGSALEALFARFPKLRSRMLDSRGSLFPYLALFRNDEAIPPRADLTGVELTEGDRLELVAIVEGGAPAAGGPHDVRMKGFASRVPLEDALASLLGAAPIERKHERTSLEGSCGRILAQDVVSPVSVPAFRRSAMDGYAVRAEDTFGASAYDPIRLRLVGEVMPGQVPDLQVGSGEAARIMTGACVPEGADAVLRAEDASEAPGNAEVAARAPVAPKKNVARVGEDVDEGALVMRAGRRLRAQDVGLLSSIGASDFAVIARPRVRVIVTGNELLPPGSMPEGTRIVDSNTPMLRALIARDGGCLEQVLRLTDDPEVIRKALTAPGADVIICAGGSSVGREDHLPILLADEGELLFHGVAMRPAAPAGAGALPGGALCVLLPGNPVSCLAGYDLLAGPLLRLLGGLSQQMPYASREVELSRKVASQLGRVDYVRLVLEDDGRARPIAKAGASILMSTVNAAGFALIPAHSEGLAAGEPVLMYDYDLSAGL
ncbi:MAG: molybdopterin-binding protein [Planctomycetota bacterium]